MRSPTFRPTVRTRSWVLALGAAFGAVTISAYPAAAAPPPPGHYTLSATGGATYSLLSSGNLVSGVSDDVLYYLSTTSTGINRLPFAPKVYNKSFQKMAISSNGNIQMGFGPGQGSAQFSNDCLPTTFQNDVILMPFWDDLYFDSNDTSEGFTEGVFVRTSGTAPHRSFTVAWQGHLFSNAGSRVLAQVIFKEGSQTVTFVYGLNGGESATVGVQAGLQRSFTQWTCNSGSTTSVTSGMKLTFLHSN